MGAEKLKCLHNLGSIAHVQASIFHGLKKDTIVTTLVALLRARSST